MSDCKMSDILDALMPYISDSVSNELIGNEDSLLHLLQKSISCVNSESRGELDLSLKYLKSVIYKVWEHLNVGKWDSVPNYYKNLYSYACFIKVIALLKIAKRRNEMSNSIIKKALKTTDMGLLLGGSFRKELTESASLLSSYLDLNYPYSVRLFDELTYETNNVEKITGEPVASVECPSLEYFHKNYFSQHLPVKLTGCIDHWPALRSWQNIEHMFKIIGPRTVPVEIGSSYASSDWSQKLMTGDEFIKRFILAAKEQPKTGYLAQHQLFNQIPELLNDIREHEYCCLSENESNEGTDINMWFGPANTISPMHYDPKHNILSQVVGSKKVLLYKPQWTDCLYPHEDTLLFNTSRIDITNPDYHLFPKFSQARALECTLNKGELLYIPPKWWHYVRSLTTSISVSFWWGT